MRILSILIPIILFSCNSERKTAIKGDKNQNNNIVIADKIDKVEINNNHNDTITSKAIAEIKDKQDITSNKIEEFIDKIELVPIPEEKGSDKPVYPNMDYLKAKKIAKDVLSRTKYISYLHKIDTILFKDLHEKSYIVVITNQEHGALIENEEFHGRHAFVLRSFGSNWNLHIIYTPKDIFDIYMSDWGYFKCGAPEIISVENRPFLFFNHEMNGNKGGEVDLNIASLSKKRIFSLLDGGSWIWGEGDEPDQVLRNVQIESEAGGFSENIENEQYAMDYLEKRFLECKGFSKSTKLITWDDYMTDWKVANYEVVDNPNWKIESDYNTKLTKLKIEENPFQSFSGEIQEVEGDNYNLQLYRDYVWNPIIGYNKQDRYYFIVYFLYGKGRCDALEINYLGSDKIEVFHGYGCGKTKKITLDLNTSNLRIHKYDEN